MKVQVELDELLELQARVVELEQEVKKLNFRLTRCDNFNVTITDIEGNKNNFPDHTMD